MTQNKMTLEDLLRSTKRSLLIVHNDYCLGKPAVYIHVHGEDCETLEFVVHGNELLPRIIKTDKELDSISFRDVCVERGSIVGELSGSIEDQSS